MGAVSRRQPCIVEREDERNLPAQVGQSSQIKITAVKIVTLQHVGAPGRQFKKATGGRKVEVFPTPPTSPCSLGPGEKPERPRPRQTAAAPIQSPGKFKAALGPRAASQGGGNFNQALDGLAPPASPDGQPGVDPVPAVRFMQTSRHGLRAAARRDVAAWPGYAPTLACPRLVVQRLS